MTYIENLGILTNGFFENGPISMAFLGHPVTPKKISRKFGISIREMGYVRILVKFRRM